VIHWFDDNFIDPYREAYEWISGANDHQELVWRYVQFVFTRATPAGTQEDVAVFGLNLLNMTSGQIDSSWDTTDYTEAETDFTEWLGTLNSYFSNTITLKELRWYVRQFNPDLPLGSSTNTLDPATGKPYARFAQSGTVARVHPVNTVGGATAFPVPYQVAMSVTFKTAQAKHWGRIYLPGVTQGWLDTTDGRFGGGVIVPIANATAELADDLAKRQLHLVIPTTQAGGKFHVALQTVTQIQVDDIPDVIRSRRPKQTKIRQAGVPLP